MKRQVNGHELGWGHWGLGGEIKEVKTSNGNQFEALIQEPCDWPGAWMECPAPYECSQKKLKRLQIGLASLDAKRYVGIACVMAAGAVTRLLDRGRGGSLLGRRRSLRIEEAREGTV